MTVLLASSLLILLLASYLAALTLSLHRKRRSAIIRLCEERNQPDLGVWIADHREAALLVLSFLRTAARVGFFVLLLFEVIGFDEDASLTWQTVVVTALVAVLILWAFTTVITIPVAKHAGVELIVASTPLLRAAALIGRPLSKALFFVDESVRRLSGANLRDETEMQEDLLRSIEEVSIEGNLDPTAAAMIENVVEFRSAEVSEVMTPRTDIEGIEYTDDISTIRLFIEHAGHSRIPVYRENLDQIDGILYVKDLVPFLGEPVDNFNLQSILRKPIVVPETKSVPELLGDFQQSEVHMAIVIDEYGGTAGLVTIEDVLEEIVGEIHDEHEPEHDEEPALTVIDETRGEVGGRFHIDDLNERLKTELPEEEDYDTVAGFMLAHLGRIPMVGDTFVAHNVRFTVLEASETQINRVGVELLGKSAGGVDGAK